MIISIASCNFIIKNIKTLIREPGLVMFYFIEDISLQLLLHLFFFSLFPYILYIVYSWHLWRFQTAVTIIYLAKRILELT